MIQWVITCPCAIRNITAGDWNVSIRSWEIKGNISITDFWTPVAYFYGINRIDSTKDYRYDVTFYAPISWITCILVYVCNYTMDVSRGREIPGCRCNLQSPWSRNIVWNVFPVINAIIKMCSFYRVYLCGYYSSHRKGGYSLVRRFSGSLDSRPRFWYSNLNPNPNTKTWGKSTRTVAD